MIPGKLDVGGLSTRKSVKFDLRRYEKVIGSTGGEEDLPRRPAKAEKSCKKRQNSRKASGTA